MPGFGSLWVQPAQPVGTGLGWAGAGEAAVGEGGAVFGFFEAAADGLAWGPEPEGEGPGVFAPGWPPAAGESPPDTGVGATARRSPASPPVVTA
ncbi:hypothetical protein VR46_41930 [Streptomyces sp. NRRL S-444]|nr:hypothetical protein VR46_41930 [Streptomyces sp. NRRL S-444]